jgi:vacuolar protein-sorting-associated protein 4
MDNIDVRLKRAASTIERAIAHDSAGRFQEALALFREALGEYTILLRSERAQHLAPTLQPNVQTYLHRAQQLQRILDEGASPRSARTAVCTTTATTTTGVRPSGGDQSGEDEELRRQMAETRLSKVPTVEWSDVVGHDEAKRELQMAVIAPIFRPELFGNKLLAPPIGVLLYGPPGTGKTQLARALANEWSKHQGCSFFNVSAASVISKWQGQSARGIKALFEEARSARPAIIFFDEVETLCVSRESESARAGAGQVVTELLNAMDGLDNEQTGLLVVGATNLPWAIDAAILRRFEARIYIPLPDEETRITHLRHHLAMTPHTLSDETILWIASVTGLYSGADLFSLVRCAVKRGLEQALCAHHYRLVDDPEGRFAYTPCAAHDQGAIAITAAQIDRDERIVQPPITRLDFEYALARVKPISSAEAILPYRRWTDEHGRG